MKSEFGNSLRLISKIKHNLFVIKNAIKKFTLLIYYEMNDYESFLITYDSHKHFLSYADWGDNELKDYRIKKTKNFSNSIDKLFKLRESLDIVEIELFEREIAGMSIDLKKWFSRKIAELKEIKNKKNRR